VTCFYDEADDTKFKIEAQAEDEKLRNEEMARLELENSRAMNDKTETGAETETVEAVEEKAVPTETEAQTIFENKENVREEPEIQAVQPAEEQIRTETEEEEKRRLAKEEARKILTQPVVQRSAMTEQEKNPVQAAKDMKEKHVIHPTTTRKKYNRKTKDTDETVVKSSLKQILDDEKPIGEN